MSDGFTYSYLTKWSHAVFRNLLEAGIWAWMCDTAAWKETKIRFNGHLVAVQRAQLATSRRFISEGFCIGEQVTRTFLENLEKEGMINQQPTHWGTLITICNYDEYQSASPTANPPGNQPPTHGQPTANPPYLKDEKEVKEKKEKSRGTRFALQDPPPDWIQFCKTQRPDLNPGILFDGFRDYWMAKAGKDGVKLDWFATWRNWVRNQKSKTGGNYGQPAKTKLDLAAEGIARAAAKREQRYAEAAGQSDDGLFRSTEALWP